MINRKALSACTIRDCNKAGKELYTLATEIKRFKKTALAPYVKVADHTTRGKYPHVPVTPHPKFGVDKFCAVHDMKDYGDTDEAIYR